MIDGRLARDRIQRGQFYNCVRARINQEVFDRFCGRSEGRLKREAVRIDSRAVPGGVNAGNPERIFRLLAADKNGKRAADVAVSNQCEAQSIIVALAARLSEKAGETESVTVDLMSMKALLSLLLAGTSLCAADANQPARTPVLVELFTSEGCSSCPPADALLMKLNDSQPLSGVNVIALEEHVYYWDRQGWRDPFSSASFTARQQRYTEWLGVESPYTPEMVVDGQKEFVGSDSGTALSELAKSARRAKTPVHLTWKEKSGGQATLTVHVDAAKSSGDVLLAITESKLASDVARGENAGRNLKHTAVVRRLTPIGKFKAGEAFSTDTVVTLASDWKPENVSAVVFVQEQSKGTVFAVGQLGLLE